MDAAIRSVVVGGLQAGVQYRVEVAASTSVGVGVKSEPQIIIIGMGHILVSKTFTVTLHLLFISDGQKYLKAHYSLDGFERGHQNLNEISRSRPQIFFQVFGCLQCELCEL